MGFRNREIEVKLRIENTSLEKVRKVLDSLYGQDKTRMIYGESKDTYWHTPDYNADFLRIRELQDGRVQLTTKATDKKTSLDRMEIDVDTYASPAKVVKLIKSILGKPAGHIHKEYYVYWIDQDEHTTVSCYRILSEENTVYIEVESTSKSQVLSLEAKVLEKLSDKNLNAKRAEGSLYDLYIRKES